MITAAELGKAHMQRDRFAGQVADVFRDIDVLLISVLNAPLRRNGTRWRRATSLRCCASRLRSI